MEDSVGKCRMESGLVRGVLVAVLFFTRT